MCARLLTCPLCSQPGFLTLDSLRTGLISVATRPLTCPVCNEVLLGIDKLTIHLFSHTVNLNGNNGTESARHTNLINTNDNLGIVHNVQNVTFEDLPVSKVQITDTTKFSQNNVNIQNNLKSSQNLQNANIEDVESRSIDPMQEQNLVNNLPEIIFNQSLDNKRVNEIHINDNTERDKSSQQMFNHAMKLNYCTKYCTSDLIEHVNSLQDHTQTENVNIQTFKTWIKDQHYEQPNTTTESKIEKCVEREKPLNSEESYNSPIATITKHLNSTQTYNTAVRKIDEEDMQKDSSAKCNEDHKECLKSKETLMELLVAERKEKPAFCNICGFHFPDSDILLLHKQLVHMVNEKKESISPQNCLKNYSCHLCSKVFKMKGSLMVHMRVAHIGYNLGSLVKDGQIEVIFHENKYNCPTCGKEFKKEQHVMQHLKTHEAKQWECDVCSKMFTTKYFLKKHKRLHSGEMPYKCNLCNKTFTFQQSYHKHRLYHKDDKPHMCTTCGRSFKELSTLHNHERIHTGEKPFACESCGKCFRQRVSYLVHRRIHTGVMPYKCSICGKSFRYKVSQRTHKCPVLQTANIQNITPSQSEPLKINTPDTSNGLYNIQQEFSKENQLMMNIINNEDNKYVLIINTRGQHLLTKESSIEKVENIMNNEEKLEKHSDVDNKSEEARAALKTNGSDDIIFKKSVDYYKVMCSKNIKPLQGDANDFFSMVMSPLESRLSSSTIEMEHLRVSSPTEQANILKPYDNFKAITTDMDLNILNTNIESNFSNTGNNATNALQTINEESLKQLLYNFNEK